MFPYYFPSTVCILHGKYWRNRVALYTGSGWAKDFLIHRGTLGSLLSDHAGMNRLTDTR